MPYRTPVITKHFPDLVDEGDDIWVTIRNPLLMPPGELTSTVSGVKASDDGTPEDDEASERATWKLAAKLIIGWRMYDASVVPELDEHGEPVPAEPVLLPVKPSPAEVGRAPMGVFMWLGEEMAKVNPQLTPASPEATSSAS